MKARSQLISQTLFLDDMETFSSEAQVISKSYRWQPFNQWVDRYVADVLSFDMTRIATTLSDFSQLVDQLGALVNQT